MMKIPFVFRIRDPYGFVISNPGRKCTVYGELF